MCTRGFSPNGDGINDYLPIDGIDYYVNNEVKVFDRYNNLVFEIQGIQQHGSGLAGQANRGLVPRNCRRKHTSTAYRSVMAAVF